MAGSRKGPMGANPWVPSPTTCGPLGCNKDAADPSTPSCFVGNTPGCLGLGDFGDPDVRRHAEHPANIQAIQALKFSLVAGVTAAVESDCAKVRLELQDMKRIRQAFADQTLLKTAAKQKWNAGQYVDAVHVHLFGKPKTSKKGGEPDKGYEVLLSIDPDSCHIDTKVTLEEFRKRGLPDIIYEAARAHEESHVTTCMLNSRYWNDTQNLPEYVSKDEVKAYDVGIGILTDWLEKNCPHHTKAK